MDKIQIYYGVRSEGITFCLPLNDFRAIQKMFPDAQLPENIYVGYDRKMDFEKYHPNLEKYIFPALMGFQNEADLKKIKKIDFVKMPERRVTYTIDQNEQYYEQEIQKALGS